MAKILALDSGTTSVRAMVFDERGRELGMCQQEIQQAYPHTGWVEEDPIEIWDKQMRVCAQLLKQLNMEAREIDCIGITNQRETLVAWDRTTGKPIYPAIVWQCRRTEAYCGQLKERGLTEWFQTKTGLIPDAYFSATKAAWILQYVEGAREMAARGDLLFGTIDTWLIWNATGGKTYATDYSNASRTMLFNIQNLDWDAEILEFFGLSRHNLPQVYESGADYGVVRSDILGAPIPITAVLGDQQSALFGHLCLEKSEAKCTYGTGAFILANIGQKPIASKQGLLTTVAWGYKDRVDYAFEGSIFMAGAVVGWLRDNLGIIRKASDTEAMAASVPSSEGVYFVSTFQGLGAPWWQNGRRASIQGMSRKTNGNHIVRAALESVAYRVRDVVGAMEREMGMPCKTLRADGGMTANRFLMQFQSDILQIPVSTGTEAEVTALGAAYMAGLTCGIWRDAAELAGFVAEAKRFYPQISAVAADQLYGGWLEAIGISAKEIT